MATTNADGVAKLTRRRCGVVAARGAREGLAPGRDDASAPRARRTPSSASRSRCRAVRHSRAASSTTTGKPVGAARVVATNASEPLPVVDPRRDGVVAGADGTFSIPALAAGTWRLTATHGDLRTDDERADHRRWRARAHGLELVMSRGCRRARHGQGQGRARRSPAPTSASSRRATCSGARAARRSPPPTARSRSTASPPRAVDVVAWHESAAPRRSCPPTSRRSASSDVALDARRHRRDRRHRRRQARANRSATRR